MGKAHSKDLRESGGELELLAQHRKCLNDYQPPTRIV